MCHLYSSKTPTAQTINLQVGRGINNGHGPSNLIQNGRSYGYINIL